MSVERKLPLSKALGFIALSVFIVWGTLFSSRWFHNHIIQKRMRDHRFIIQGIVISCSDPDMLLPGQIAALLGLDGMASYNLYEFDPQSAKAKVLAFPAIQSCSISRLRPNAVFICYKMRTPRVLLADFENVALDEKGFAFALYPFYSPKKLPEFYLGVKSLNWNEPVSCYEYMTAQAVLEEIQKLLPLTSSICRVDTHAVLAASRGQREIVVVLQDGGCRRFLRLPTTNYKKSLTHFIALRPTLDTMLGPAQTEQIIDLRGSGYALIK